jgi:hypothetical protein
MRPLDSSRPSVPLLTLLQMMMWALGFRHRLLCHLAHMITRQVVPVLLLLPHLLLTLLWLWFFSHLCSNRLISQQSRLNRQPSSSRCPNRCSPCFWLSKNVRTLLSSSSWQTGPSTGRLWDISFSTPVFSSHQSSLPLLQLFRQLSYQLFRQDPHFPHLVLLLLCSGRSLWISRHRSSEPSVFSH